MNEEFKTLNEIRTLPNGIDLDTLKQEAIKWVKNKCPATIECRECKAVNRWIKMFFNIPGDDE